MKLIKTLTRILKYYIILHLTTLFIYIYSPVTASTFYVVSILSLLLALIYGLPLKKYVILNFAIAIIISIIHILGPWIIAVFFIMAFLLWKDIILLIR